MTEKKQNIPNKNQTPILIKQSDLPLACPQPSQTLWNAHPRVYLPIQKTKEATCPYCGTQYQLV